MAVERSVNQGPWLLGRVYLKNNAAHQRAFAGSSCIWWSAAVRDAPVVMGSLFRRQERRFLYRREEVTGAFRFLFSHEDSLPPARFLTCRAPICANADAGRTLRFNLRQSDGFAKTASVTILLMGETPA